MSGKATKHPVRRLNAKEHSDLQHQISRFLDEKGIIHRFPMELLEKESFGDIDVVILHDEEKNATGIEFPDYVRGVVRRRGFTHAAWPIPGLSGEDNYAQVDFISATGQAFPHTASYLSHGTLSNHIGLLCRSIGLRYRMDGLALIVRNPETGQKVGNILIESDPYKALKLLEIQHEDIEKFLNGGFKTKEESYHFLFKFPFFHPQALNPTRMTAANRAREKKRPETSYLKDWIQQNQKLWEDMPQTKTPLPDRDDQKSYLSYQQHWLQRLLGKKLEELQPEIKKIQDHVLNKKKEMTPERKWFSDFAKASGIPEETVGKAVWQIAKAKKISLKDYLSQTSPQEASEYLKETTNPE